MVSQLRCFRRASTRRNLRTVARSIDWVRDMPEASGSREPSGKWAAEFYDFLRIFRRINNSIYGLLLVEVAWVFFLILLGRLSSSKPPVITVPWTNAAVPVSDVFLPGAAALLLLWMWWSR